MKNTTVKLTKNDRWAVISPGRTGSKVIVDYIMGLYEQNGILLNYISPQESIENPGDGSLLHTHQSESYIPLRDTNTNIVISTRDLVDASISWCVQSHIGAWHLYSSDDYMNVKITPFVLDLKEFYEHYDDALLFYKNLAKDMIQYYPKLTIIDYSEFETDSDVIPELLGVTDSVKVGYKPIKNPGSPEAWISNWHDIQTELYRLKRIAEVR